MKVLVTGGAGYVGHVLVPTLADRGHEVIVADWLMFDMWPVGSSENILVDIRDTDNWEFNRALKGSDCIIHLAAISNDPSSELDPDLTWSVNVGGTINVVRGSGLQRIIYASSSSVYGNMCDTVATEDSPVNPLTRYAMSKVWAERVIDPTILDMIVVRPATVMGYSPRMRFDLMVNGFVGQAVQNGQINLWGGFQYRPLVHIQDIVDLYCLLVEHGGTISGIFNAVAAVMTTKEIAELVCEYAGAEINHTSVCDDNRSYRTSGKKLKDIFGWAPQRTVEDAIMEVLEAIHEGKTDHNDDRCFNVRWMQRKGHRI